MKFDLTLHITEQQYKASSALSGFHANDDAVCISTMTEKMESFLSIGEPVSRFASDPMYKDMQSKGQLKHFNPFDPGSFEPKNALLVVCYYLLKVHQSIREPNHPFIQQMYRTFWDRCDLTLLIDGYERINSATREKFEKEIESIQTVGSWHIN